MQHVLRMKYHGKNAMAGMILAIVITSLSVAPACNKQQVQQVVNSVQQYLPTALAVTTDILTILPLLAPGVTPTQAAAYGKDAQQANDAVNLISSDIHAYATSPSTATLGKVSDAVTAAQQSLNQLLQDIHVFNATTVAKITAYVGLAQEILVQIAQVIGSTSVAKAKALVGNFSPAQAAQKLNEISAMPII